MLLLPVRHETRDMPFASVSVSGLLDDALIGALESTLDVLADRYAYRHVVLNLCCGGGRLDALWRSVAFIGMLSARGVRVDTHVRGYAAGLGLVLAALGERRSVSPYAVLYPHPPALRERPPAGDTTPPSLSCSSEVEQVVDNLLEDLVAVLAERVVGLALPRAVALGPDGAPCHAQGFDLPVLERLLPREVLDGVAVACASPEASSNPTDAARAQSLGCVLRRLVDLAIGAEPGSGPELGLSPDQRRAALSSVCRSLLFGPPGASSPVPVLAVSSWLWVTLGLADAVGQLAPSHRGEPAPCPSLPHGGRGRELCVLAWEALFSAGRVPLTSLERGVVALGDRAQLRQCVLAPLLGALLRADRATVARVVVAAPHLPGGGAAALRGAGFDEAAPVTLGTAQSPVALFGAETREALVASRAQGSYLQVASRVLAEAALHLPDSPFHRVRAGLGTRGVSPSHSPVLRSCALDHDAAELACATGALVLLVLEPDLLAPSAWAASDDRVRAFAECLLVLAYERRWSLLALIDWALRCGALTHLGAASQGDLPPCDGDDADDPWTLPEDDEAQRRCVLEAAARLLLESFPSLSQELRIPVETDHPIQSKPITDSIPSRSPIPVDADH